MPIVSATAKKSKEVLSYYNPKTWKEKGLRWTIGLFVVTYIIFVFIFWFYWSREPDLFDVNA
ncbi:MAG TPA: DUF2333 family protein, partial [Oceanospirillales bacterium]|nr:DUF2333 family protein [Oceanospirillales bacterium]